LKSAFLKKPEIVAEFFWEDLGGSVTLDRERYAGLADFRYALRRFLAASEVISRASGVTAQQYQVLLAIGCGPVPMTMKELSEQLLLQSHAAVQLVNRLESAALVRRQPSPSDGRSVFLELTPTGESLLTRLADQHLQEMLKQEPLLARSLRRLRQAAS
jgi:DNA-binding MarR family transcriptional regulator